MASRDLTLLRTGSALLRVVPIGVAGSLARAAASFLAPWIGGTKDLGRNLSTIGVADPDKAARAGIGAYAKYWADTLGLPHLSNTAIDRRFSFIGYHHILDVQQAGATPVMVLPHLGSWEWAAAWLGRLEDQNVVAVVEDLEPEVFAWFKSNRESYGVTVVPLGSKAWGQLSSESKAPRTVVCLLADRDIHGGGVEVEFFGRSAEMPAGPAMFSIRTGNPLLPVAIYDRGSTRECHVLPPIWPSSEPKLRENVRTTTQTVAAELQRLIAKAPEQWHVLSDVWPEPASVE